MSDLIDREAILSQLSGKNVFSVNTSTEMETARAYAYGETICLIEHAPVVDAVEVRHGKWVYDHWCVYKCSECGYTTDHYKDERETSYCPNCGAFMDGRKKEGEE